jgi:hypothetical protein
MLEKFSAFSRGIPRLTALTNNVNPLAPITIRAFNAALFRELRRSTAAAACASCSAATTPVPRCLVQHRSEAKNAASDNRTRRVTSTTRVMAVDPPVLTARVTLCESLPFH